jgi:hypothetical protein
MKIKNKTIKNLSVMVVTAGLFTTAVPSIKATICNPTPVCVPTTVVDCSTPPTDCYKTPCTQPAPKITSVPEPSTIVAGALLLLPFGVSTVRILRRHKAE